MRRNAIVNKCKMLKFRVASEVRRKVFEEEEIRTRCDYRYVQWRISMKARKTIALGGKFSKAAKF